MFASGAEDARVLACGLVTVGAILVSGLAHKEDRLRVALCAAGLHVSWVVYVMAWTPWSPAIFLSRYVSDTDSISIWTFMNCLNAGLAIELWLRDYYLKEWLAALYALLLSACFLDVMYAYGVIQWVSFNRVADFIFVAEMAILYAVGGRNGLALVRDCFARWRVRHKSSPALQKASPPVAGSGDA